jgi:glutathione S-transferase
MPPPGQWRSDGGFDVITLYHCSDARSFRPLWTLEELGLEYELKMLPFPPRVRAKDYLAINPLGTIPTLLDGETMMTESAAMIEYLIARYGPGDIGVGVDDPAYGAYLNYLHQGEATLTFPQTLVLRYTRLEPPERRQPQVADDYAKWFLARLRAAIEPVVARQPFLLGERFTGADISVGYALLLAHSLGLADQFAPPITEYWRRLSARHGFQKAKAAQKREAEAQGAGRPPI